MQTGSRGVRRTMFVCVVVLGSAVAAAAVGDDLNPVNSKPPADHASVTLVEKGSARASIVVMNVPGSREFAMALAELEAAIEETTGAKLSVVRGKAPDGPAIVIGACDEAKAAGLDGAAMPVEGFAIKSVANRVFIVGHDDPKLNSPGTAWGVYEFLERIVGVRWYWPMELGGRSVVPTKDLAVKPIWIEDAPTFRKREIWPPVANTWSGTGTQLLPLHTALRSGDSWPIRLIVHAPMWNRFDDLTKNRPECFQLRGDGSRNFEMLCYSNPRTLATYIEHCEAVFDRREDLPEARTAIRGDAVTVSPADMGVRCYCDDCKRLWDPEGGEFGTASRTVASFVQKLATEVKRRWPDKTVIYLPYMNYTTAPDGIQFPGNVEVQLCGMPGIAQYKEPTIAASEQENLDRWRRISGRRIQNWHYSCWPADRTKSPYQYPHAVADYYRKNREHLVGSFINGTGDHWPRHHISLYCWLKLLWDPDFDVDAAIREYCRRMYGPASAPMLELTTLAIDGWEKSRWPHAALAPRAIYEHSYPAAALDRMKGLLQKARIDAAGDKLVLARLDYFEQPFAEFYREFDFVVHGKGTRPIIAQKVIENPTIDGKLDDEVWKKAVAHRLVQHDKDKGEIECKFATDVRVVWTLDGVTFGFQMAEPNPRQIVQNIRSNDDPLLYWQDCVEFFLDTSGTNAGDWYQFILNAAGSVYDAHKTDTAWDLAGLKLKSFAAADSWSMEVYVPVAGLPGARPPGTGVEWHGQLVRHRMDHESKQVRGRENQKFNAQFAGFNSNVADFAPIRFVE